MRSSRGAKNLSECVRGLILLHAAHRLPELLAGPNLPEWINRDKKLEEDFLTREDNAAEMTTGKV